MRSSSTSILRLLALAALGVMAAGAAAASGLPMAMPDRTELRQVGAGRLSWLGFDIYQASLWTDTGRYDGPGSGQTVALSLWYARRFSREELLDITDEAWRRLGRAPDERRNWLALLRPLWSDVAPGHNLTAVVAPAGATRFYDHERYLGHIDDPHFGPAFLSIWLDSRSVVRDLRVALLGETPVTGPAAGTASR
ncbi:MAG: hypothetical protein FIB04_14475 [Gammaproteobacteria bacterium]|nr:hypothetical protein [Gammaproteobacteria bacterium]